MLQQTLPEPGTFIPCDADHPIAGRGEVIIQMEAVTVCGSDIRVFTGEKTGGVIWPAVIGHEFNGIVVDIGPEVNVGVALNQRVAVVPWVSCGVCPECRTGNGNVCDQLRVFGYQIHGGLSEYVRIPAEAVAAGNLVPLPDDIDPAAFAMAEPLACVLNGHLRSGIDVGDTVLILGAGPIGMLHTKLAAAAGARRVIVSEPNSERARAMLGVGATDLIDPTTDDPVERVLALTDGRGADVTIICIGIAGLVDVATAATRPNGVVNLFAGFGGDGRGMVSLNLPHYKQQTLLGNAGGTVELYRRAVAMIASGQIEVASMITHRFPLSRAEEAVRFAASGAGVKVAVLPDSAFVS